MRKRLVIIAVALVLAAAGVAFAFRASLREMIEVRFKPALPAAAPYQPEPEAPAAVQPPAPEPTTPPKSPPVVLQKKEVNLAVPFTPQAPYANWDELHEEACEEAALIMVNAYYKGVTSLPPAEAERQILAMVDWENAHFGYYKDTTAEETAEIAREYYDYPRAHAVAISSMEDVKKEIDRGRPVILPAAGRLLGNPYFSGAGPLYHMIVVKGYTKEGKIITNDAGTRRGADYLYDPVTLWNAVHDWNGGDVMQGAKMMIVVER